MSTNPPEYLTNRLDPRVPPGELWVDQSVTPERYAQILEELDLQEVKLPEQADPDAAAETDVPDQTVEMHQLVAVFEPLLQRFERAVDRLLSGLARMEPPRVEVTAVADPPINLHLPQRKRRVTISEDGRTASIEDAE